MVEEASSDLVAVWEIHLADGIHVSWSLSMNSRRRFPSLKIEISEFEDFVQSVDVAAMNKV